MELFDYLAVLRKRWIGLVATILLTMAVVVGFTLASTPQYQATTRLFFAVPGGETIAELAQGSSFTEKQMSSYAQVATSPLVLGRVVDEIQGDLSTEQLAHAVRAVVPANTVILEVTATSTHPEHAAAIANSVGRQLAGVVSDLYPKRLDGVQAVLATTLSPATVPSTATTPDMRRNLILGLTLGVGLGIAVAVVLNRLDTKIRSSRDIESTANRAVLGSVVYDPDAPARPLAMVDNPNGIRAETIRRLRTNLQFVNAASEPSRALLVTSSLPGEGKSTTAANLAIALADAGSRVLLVDADLRRPSLHKILGQEGSAGLTSVLIGRVAVGSVIQPWQGGRIDVLTAGPIPPNPSELLGSSAMARLLESLRESYDVVLLDSPPLLPVTDAAVLGAIVDGVLLVVAAGRTHKNQLLNGIQALSNVNARILGVILNKLETRSERKYGSYNEYSYGTTFVFDSLQAEEHGEAGQFASAHAGQRLASATQERRHRERRNNRERSE